MTLLERKELLHKKIDNLNDESLIEELESIIAHREKVFIIPEHMKEGIREGLEDIKHGRVHTMEDFEKKYEKWLKE